MKISDINTTIQTNQINTQYQSETNEVSAFEHALKTAAQNKDVAELKKVATQFEELFMNMMLKAMRATVGDGGLVEKSNQFEIFQGMLDENFAESFAEAGGIGIADMMIEQMRKYVAEDQSVQSQFDSRV